MFLTIAPWEFYFPWPHWLQKVMEATNLGPARLPAAEAIALAHGVREFCTGYLAGRHAQWSTNVFGNKWQKSNNVLAFVGRWEFQEGGPSHTYGKGRGSLHCHVLFWMKHLRAISFERFICGTLPTVDPELAALALQRQGSIPGCTGGPVVLAVTARPPAVDASIATQRRLCGGRVARIPNVRLTSFSVPLRRAMVGWTRRLAQILRACVRACVRMVAAGRGDVLRPTAIAVCS